MSDAEADVQCVETHAKIESRDLDSFRRLVECGVRQWRCSDGALFFDTSDSMLTLVESNTQVFFDVMAGHNREFEAWLHKLAALSFTWFQDPPSPLEAKRQMLIHLLSTTRVDGTKAAAERLRVLSTLKSIKPRQVD
jgi:hypothetical protein